MSYKHLSLEERHYIEIELKKGSSQNQIAKSLGRSQGSISRELKRNTTKKGYSHIKAHQQTQARLSGSLKSIKLTKDIQILLDKYICKDKETDGDLYTHLRHQKRRYKKRFNFKRNPSKIPNRRDIADRPEVVNNRARVGDWKLIRL